MQPVKEAKVQDFTILFLLLSWLHFPSLSELLSSQFNSSIFPVKKKTEGLGVNGFPVFEESNKFFVSWFSNCQPYKHLLYNFLAWFPSHFLTLLIHVLVHIALSFHKFLLFPPFSSFLPSLPSQKLICAFLTGFSLSFKVGHQDGKVGSLAIEC